MKDDRVYLGHIREAIQDIERYASIGRDAFMKDKMRQDALLRKPTEAKRHNLRHRILRPNCSRFER